MGVVRGRVYVVVSWSTLSMMILRRHSEATPHEGGPKSKSKSKGVAATIMHTHRETPQTHPHGFTTG